MADTSQNPLAAKPRRAAAPSQHLMMHAKAAHLVSQLPLAHLAKETRKADYSLPVLGELAADPDVTAKDVIKAISQAAADEVIQPSEAVHIVSMIPPEPDKLRPWLRQMYASTLSTAAHLKATMIRNGMMPAPGAAPPQGATEAAPQPAPESGTPTETPA